ncbi:hypothetical protein Sphch_2982 [Sphingobium chlorophenolicum L-1]|uniref:Uncharacterized protein n=1 Tax=Sphingobium chlorophenolicum L-1 TaxID=690566 RepID=F6F2F0_SPHCR|nr:hypothetical protein Sphch_2982 [Sphingobium chlorophenolicum L-1]
MTTTTIPTHPAFPVIPAKAGTHLPPHPEAQGRGNAQ